MSIATRISKLARLGQRYNIEGDLDVAIEMNALSLQNLEDFQALMRMPAFKFFIERLRRDLQAKQEKLNELTLDPEGNKFRICFYRASFEDIKRIIAFFENVVSQGPALRKEEKRLQEAVVTNI